MKYITKENFSSVINGEKPVLIDFWADWCGPCKMLSPIIEELSNEITNVDIYKCNVDEVEEVASSLEIQTIPTLIIFKGGKVLARKVGGSSKNIMKEWIDLSIK